MNLIIPFAETFNKFPASARAFELAINILKTDVLFQPKPGAKHSQDLSVMIDNKPFKEVRSFKHPRIT